MGLSYNGVDLDYILTRSVDMEALYEPNRVERIGVRVTITVRAVVSWHLQGTPANWVTINRAKLLEPRKQLRYEVNKKLVILSDEFLDIRHGPLPIRCVITQVTTETFLVDYTIETTLWECPGAPARTPDVVSHRWRETASIDENFMTKWTRVGSAIFSDAFVPDEKRDEFYPPIETGFKRVRNEWTIAEDGLSYSYIIEDQEVYLNPPMPATKASGWYMESSSNNAVRYGEVYVRLEGAKTTPKQVLLTLAVTVAMRKLEAQGRLLIPRGAVVKEDMYSNAVEVTIKAQWSASKHRIRGVSLKGTGIGIFPHGSTQATPSPNLGERGTGRVRIISSTIVDWCNASRVNSNIGGLFGNQPDPGAANPNVTIGPPVIGGGGDFDIEETDPVYTEYTITKRYVSVANRLQLPVAQSAGTMSAVVQLAAPTSSLIVEWTAERIGGKPEIPDSKPRNPNVILMSETHTPEEVTPVADGVSQRYRIGGTIVYAFIDSSLTQIEAGLPPWVGGAAAGTVTYSTTTGGLIGNEA